MKAKDVITIGRKRARAASTAASTIGLAVGAQFARELDDEDRVLGRERDQQHEADLDVEIVVDACSAVQHRDRPDQRQRHGEDDRERRVPALVLAGEHQVDEQQRQREDQYI